MIFRTVLKGLRVGSEFCRMLIGEGLLALGCLLWSPVAIVLSILLPRERGKRCGRRLACVAFRCYLRCLALMRVYRFNLAALDGLRQAPPMIIAPNHPSLLDALVILSRNNNAACILKASLLDNFFLGSAARLAGHIPNNWFIGTISLAVESLQNGSHVLLFPEGTRTEQGPVDPIKGSIGVIAKRANVPIQTVIIDTDTLFLGKGWPWWRSPVMPITYTVRLGERFDPPHDIARLPQMLEASFRRALNARI
ncbi:MAG TPA: lysophospholipid acyltransferase family protein [Rhodocyclaceae bacterium]|nr:lysophospholipid acyltransferase family protein [Rhodocyclaceae bacterium]